MRAKSAGELTDIVRSLGKLIGGFREPADRLVFIHVPRTGGTTLHAILASLVRPSMICPARHNTLDRLTPAQLSGSRLFSGHYDRHALALIPGQQKRVATMLRDPAARLVSVYRYLRAHSGRVIEQEGFDLARAARDETFAGFLRAAVALNAASVDNTYLRAFGLRLPHERWEQRSADAGGLLDDGPETQQALVSALAFLDTLDVVGLLDYYDESQAAVCRAFGFQPPKTYPVRNRREDSFALGEEYASPPREAVIDDTHGFLDSLTRYDRIIYDHVRATRFADGRHARPGAEQAVPPAR